MMSNCSAATTAVNSPTSSQSCNINSILSGQTGLNAGQLEARDAQVALHANRLPQASHALCQEPSEPEHAAPLCCGSTLCIAFSPDDLNASIFGSSHHDSFSSCSSGSSSPFGRRSNYSGSKGSVSSDSLGYGRLNWSKVFEAGNKGQGVTVGLLHDRLSSPDRLRKTPDETKVAAEERQARAERLRMALVQERMARLKQEQLARQQRKAEKDDTKELSAAAARSASKHQRSELLRAAHISRIRAKAGDETRKVEEVNLSNTLSHEGKKAGLQHRLEEGDARRAEALAGIRARQQDAAAGIKEAAERRRQAEAERLAALADRQRRKQEAQVKLEEDRRAAAAAREAAQAAVRAVAEQREAQRQQQAALLSSRIHARLEKAAERRLQHLELIRERAALGKDFERRDSFTAANSRSSSPTVQLNTSSSSSDSNCKSSSQLMQQRSLQSRSSSPVTHRNSTCSSSAAACVPSSTTAIAAAIECTTTSSKTSRLNAAAPCFCPGAAVTPAVAVAASSVVSVASCEIYLGKAAAAVARLNNSIEDASLPCEGFQQLQGHSQSIAEAGFTPASSLRTSKKGARRRMAKARRVLLEPG
eukprot:GHRR01025888.1.p1 GENE.GHRR01025888.1~~GHRR01025888.1.p1  ORF type:complete len:610 (+),score=296.05 GHRR01025888.1:60-1832(+)